MRAERRLGAGDRRGVDPRVRVRCVVGWLPEDTPRVLEFLIGKEPCLPLPDGQSSSDRRVAVIVEEEQADGPLLRVGINVDVVPEVSPGLGSPPW